MNTITNERLYGILDLGLCKKMIKKGVIHKTENHENILIRDHIKSQELNFI